MIWLIIKISLRNLLKYKLHSLINILGLALGFSAFILISLFVRYELNWDKSNLQYDRIYRLQRHYSKTMFAMDGNDISPHTRAITAQLLEKKFPEFARVTVIHENGGKFLAYNPDRQIFNDKGICADSCFFDVFTYRFLEGSQKGALDEPFNIILSKTMADRLFGKKSALGSAVILEKKFTLNVTGVYEDLPENSSLRPDYIISFSSLAKTGGITRSDIRSADCMTYALLNQGIDFKALGSKIKNVFSGFSGLEFEELQLCPMSMIYLNFNGKNDYIVALILYGFIGFFILLMSAFNYINLTTANASVRGKEVALKKVCGSSRFTLVVQFLCETILTSIIALLLAFEIASAFLPVFSDIIYKRLTLNIANDISFIGLTILIAITVGLLSGIYPALILSSQNILSLFKGQAIANGHKKFTLKNALVSFQFAISIFLMIITISFSLQISYMSERNLGFNKENLLFTKMSVSNQEITFDQLRARVLQNPSVTDAFMTKNLPFVSFGGGMTNWEGGDPNEKISCRFNTVSYDFVNALGIEVIAGRDFSREFTGDAGKSCLINESALRCFGWDNPIGKKLNNNRLTVVGVVRNYTYKDMHNGIEPAILMLSDDKVAGDWTFAFRVKPGSEQKAKAFLTEEFKRTFPNDPFEFNDLPNAFATENTFKTYHSVNRTFLFFTVFNIFLAMIGLFGMVSFTVVKRTKEIGIRKINGSSSASIFHMLSKDYYIMLLFAIATAFPAAIWTGKMIPGADKLPPQLWVYLLSTVIILVIILLTTSYLTIRAATQNPVEALRYE
jgi:putative ABC transport system permease protein